LASTALLAAVAAELPPGRFIHDGPTGRLLIYANSGRLVFSDARTTRMGLASSFFLDFFAAGISFPPVVQSRQHCGRKNRADTRQTTPGEGSWRIPSLEFLLSPPVPGTYGAAKQLRRLWPPMTCLLDEQTRRVFGIAEPGSPLQNSEQKTNIGVF